MKGITIWFTGLPCSGKTTLAELVGKELTRRGYLVEALDGDVTRKYLSKGLGFSKEDRDENIRRVGFVCSLLTRHRAIVTAAFVSPYRAIRAEIRQMIGNFFEVYVKCSLEKCIERDVKGMYKKALAGEIKNFTGVSDPYEEPENPELIIYSDQESETASADKIIRKLEELGYIQDYNPQIELPLYMNKELQKIMQLKNQNSFNAFIISILNDYLQSKAFLKEIDPAEEAETIEKLKRLGYLS